MAEFVTDVIDVPELVGYVRENAVLEGPTLAGLIPAVTVDDLEFELQNIEAVNMQVARFRAWDTAPPLGRRPGMAIIRGEIAPLGLSMTLNEREIKRFAALRAGLAEGTDEDVYDDARICAQACAVRQELVRADLIVDGKVTINENGFSAEATYPVPGANFIAPATPWSTYATAVPVNDFLDAEEGYRARNSGRNPDAWLVSSEVVGDLTLSTQIRELAYATSPTVPSIITQETVGAVFRAMGVRAPLVVFDEQLPDATETLVPAIPTRKVIGVRRGTMNVFVGTTPSAELMAGNGIISRRDAAGIIAWVEQEIRPARVITTAENVCMGVLRDPNALMVLTV